MPDEFDVFLSHNSRDKPVVVEIATHLRGKGLRVWLDKDELRPGFPWQEGLEEGVKASRSVAVFVGKDGLGTWQEPEMRAFLARSKRESIPVIPVLLPGCPDSPQLTLFLEALTWVDLRQGLTEDGLARLIWGITGKKDERAGVPSTSTREVSERPSHVLQRMLSRTTWSWGVGLALLIGVVAYIPELRSYLLTSSSKPESYAVRVQILDPQGSPVSGSTIHTSVGSELKRTPNGWWEVEIPAAKVPSGGLITLWAEHPDWRGNQKDLRLGNDPNVQAEIRLKQPETWLRGQVVDESGRALPDVRVSRQDGAAGGKITDSEGRFALKLSDPPETRIRLRAEHKGLAPGETYCFAGRDTCSILLEEQ